MRHPLTFLSPWNVTRKFGLRFGEQLIHLTSHRVLIEFHAALYWQKLVRIQHVIRPG